MYNNIVKNENIREINICTFALYSLYVFIHYSIYMNKKKMTVEMKKKYNNHGVLSIRESRTTE